MVPLSNPDPHPFEALEFGCGPRLVRRRCRVVEVDQGGQREPGGSKGHLWIVELGPVEELLDQPGHVHQEPHLHLGRDVGHVEAVRGIRVAVIPAVRGLDKKPLRPTAVTTFALVVTVVPSYGDDIPAPWI